MATLLCLLATSALAADVSGKWTASVPGRQGNNMDVTFTFKADGNKLTGSMANQMGEREIQDGAIDGDNISFSQTFERNGNSVKLMYKGKVNGDTIEFERSMQGGGGGGGRTQTFTAKRAK
jgi:hypothetical protein